MSFLKGMLGVKRTTTNWAVLRECGHEPLQFYWFRSVVKLYNSMLKSKSETLSRVLKADLSIHSRDPSCWTALFCRSYMFFKGCGVVIHWCKQCGRVLPFLCKSSLMISGTDCGQCGERSRIESTGHKQQVGNI